MYFSLYINSKNAVISPITSKKNFKNCLEQLKQYEYKNSDLDCYSVDEYLGIDDWEKTGETVS